jgi:hypothetical protein
MESQNLTFAQCLGEAQKLGYAEADPGFDTGGFDTAHKLAILTSLAFGTVIDPAAIRTRASSRSRASRSGGGTRLPCQLPRCRATPPFGIGTTRVDQVPKSMRSPSMGHPGSAARRRGA